MISSPTKYSYKRADDIRPYKNGRMVSAHLIWWHNMKLPIRKPNRLKNYDYTKNGAYFITICTHNRECILSQIPVGEDIILPQNEDIILPQNKDIILPQKIELSKYGKIVDKAINEIAIHYEGIFVDKYVIMPNHIHIIIRINQEDSGRMISAPTVIAGMKRYVSKQIGKSIWQKSFYDHIIRDDEDYQRICQYIDENPFKWDDDELNTK